MFCLKKSFVVYDILCKLYFTFDEWDFNTIQHQHYDYAVNLDARVDLSGTLPMCIKTLQII